MKQGKVIIRGGGDLATAIIQKFYRSGFTVLVLEVEKPTAIRRNVSLCSAVFCGSAQVEDMVCKKVENLEQAQQVIKNGEIPLLVDPKGESIVQFKPDCLVDAIIAKKNLGTNKTMAPITIGIGPGFEAGVDVTAVIETMRGHDLGRLIESGFAFPNTGIPGEIGGKSEQRVIHAPVDGVLTPNKDIGQVVQEGELLLTIGTTQVLAPFTGLVRGMITPGFTVKKGLKIADIDPRTDVNWHTISDKARCIGGGALEAYFYLKGKE